jgi:DNA-binding winged helix-turn-helix (wHTH) protein
MQVRFGPFTLDDATREVRRGSDPVHFSPKAFELLALLLRHGPNAVSKADIHRELWPDTFVSDGNLAVMIAEIRRALGDSARQPAFIRTVSRFGYAFVAATSSASSGHESSLPGPTCYLIQGLERFRLHAGDNIIGRDLSADISIEAIGISRRHAAIDVGAGVVTLRDLLSKNGTFVEDARVTQPVILRDNVEVRRGAVCLQFRCSTLATATQTVEESHGLRGPS